MDTKIEEVEQKIRKVEQQIDDVEGQLTKAATEADVAYWRKEKGRLGKKEDRLREEKLLLLKADTSGLSSGVPDKLLQDLAEYLAKQKAKEESKKSVCLSSVSRSIWDKVQRQASLKMMYKDIEPKRWSDLPEFGWDERLERSQADRYTVHLNKIKCGRKWTLIDAANNYPTLLSGFLGDWHFKGTTDVAFVHRIASINGVQRGLKCIFKLKKDLGGGGRDKAMIQTVICLVMANVFAQQFKPCVVLTDLHDDWSLYWMDESTIYYCSFESRASAVGYIEELLQDFDDNEMGTSEALASYARPDGEDEDLQFIKKRRMYDPPEMDNLNDLVGLIPDEEIESARVHIALQQLQKLLHIPLFSNVPWPSNMYC